MNNFFRITSIIVLLFSLISCKQKSKKQEQQDFFKPVLDTEKEVVLTGLGFWGNFEALEEVFADFNNYYPNVSLNYEYVDRLSEAGLNRCASGDNIDFMFVQNFFMDKYYKKLSEEYLEDLSKINVDYSLFEKNTLKAGLYQNKQTYIPLYYQSCGLIVNVSLLKKYGIAIPADIHEFENACDLLLSKGITPIFTSDMFSGLLIYNHMILNLKNNPDKLRIEAELNSGKDTTDIYKEPIALLNKWYNRGYLDMGGNDLPDIYNSIILRFLEGDIPFLVGTSDTISGMKKRESKSAAFKSKPFEYTYIPSPTGEHGREAVFFSSLYFCAYKDSKNVDYTNEFFRFMYTESELKKMTTIKGMPTIYKTGDSRIKYFEELPEKNRYYLEEDELSRESLGVLYFNLQRFCKPCVDSQTLSQNFERNILNTYNR